VRDPAALRHLTKGRCCHLPADAVETERAQRGADETHLQHRAADVSGGAAHHIPHQLAKLAKAEGPRLVLVVNLEDTLCAEGVGDNSKSRQRLG